LSDQVALLSLVFQRFDELAASAQYVKTVGEVAG
jgi:hypothetical protein